MTGALRVFEPAEAGGIPAWARRHRDAFEQALLDDGVALLRGFGVRTTTAFMEAAECLSSDLEPGYTELPPDPSAERCYRSTAYPQSLPILFHNEGAHRTRWPGRQIFGCLEPAPAGGATPIADGRAVLERLDPEIVGCLRRRGLLYLRNLSPEFDLDWPQYYGSPSRAAVEAACRRSGTEFEWTQRGLRTWQRRPAFLPHPRSGAELPFHQILLHHPACLPADVRGALEAECAEDAMPRNVFFGDGERIEDAVVSELRRAYDEVAIRFDWEAGDVLALDNSRVAHARDPFSGPRQLLVALGQFAAETAPRDHGPSAGAAGQTAAFE